MFTSSTRACRKAPATRRQGKRWSHPYRTWLPTPSPSRTSSSTSRVPNRRCPCYRSTAAIISGRQRHYRLPRKLSYNLDRRRPLGFKMPEEKKFAMCPPGTHLGVCYRIVDLGTQDTTYKGEAKKARLLQISWEIPEERMDDGKPFSVAKRYTFSSNKKAIFRKD